MLTKDTPAVYSLGMSISTKTKEPKANGRPRKSAAGVTVRKNFSIAPDVWALVEQFIPDGERSALVEKALLREAQCRRRYNVHSQAEEAALIAEGMQEMAEAGQWPPEPDDLALDPNAKPPR